MLIIKAEIWPHGQVEERFEIARIGIINRSGNQSLADYNVIGLLGRDGQEHIAPAVVLGHPRHMGWRRLAANALIQDDAPIFHREYVEEVVELLKRG